MPFRIARRGAGKQFRLFFWLPAPIQTYSRRAFQITLSLPFASIRMSLFPIPSNEAKRLAALDSYGILNTAPEAEYDAIAKLASEICGTPVSLITLIDESRQWFKSAQGTEVRESSREYAFCAHTILHPEEPMIVQDLRRDSRFAENPFVTQDPHVVFYAGAPLTDGDGFPLGTLCVLDVKERTLTDHQLNALRVLANQVVTLMQLRRKLRNLQTLKGMLSERSEELQNALQSVTDTAPKLEKAISNLEWMAQGADNSTLKTTVHESLQLLRAVSEKIDKAF